MTDEQAFLDAIGATPDDDMPRLVYADWLEERGFSDRAEYIRLQCFLEKASRGRREFVPASRNPRDADAVGLLQVEVRKRDTKKVKTLRQREVELSTTFNLVSWGGKGGTVWRRGFPHPLPKKLVGMTSLFAPEPLVPAPPEEPDWEPDWDEESEDPEEVRS